MEASSDAAESRDAEAERGHGSTDRQETRRPQSPPGSGEEGPKETGSEPDYGGEEPTGGAGPSEAGESRKANLGAWAHMVVEKVKLKEKGKVEKQSVK